MRSDERAVTELSHLFWQHFRRPSAPSVEKVADDMGMSAVQLYKITEGERDVRLSDFPRLYRFSGKPIAVLKYIVSKCDPDLAVVNVSHVKPLNGGFDDEKDDLAVLQGRLVEGIREALKDGVIDEDERLRIVDLAADIRATMDRVIAEANNLADRRR